MQSIVPPILSKPVSVLLAASQQYVYVNDVEIVIAHQTVKRRIGKAIDIYASQCRKFLLIVFHVHIYVHNHPNVLDSFVIW